jgi:hypothetical protein
MTKHAFLLSSFFLFLAACTTDPTGESVATGEWGGTNVDLRITDTGASAQFKCGALGEIGAALVLDSAHRFDAAGTYDPKVVLGGPRPARFTGMVSGTTMTLNVEVEGQSIGSFQLSYGIPGSFEPCNF